MSFNIRTTLSSPSDGEFILAAFDAAIPHLVSIGSSEQWGSEPMSSDPERRAKAHDWIAASKFYRQTGSGDAVQAFIAETASPYPCLSDKGLATRTDDDGKNWISVAAAVVCEGRFPAYVAERPQFLELVKEEMEKGGSMYLNAMISDFRTGELRKGSGAALLAAVKSYAAERKVRVVFLDCWAGNGGKLIRFYEKMGFVRVGEFAAPRPGKEAWPGMVLKMEL